MFGRIHTIRVPFGLIIYVLLCPILVTTLCDPYLMSFLCCCRNKQCKNAIHVACVYQKSIVQDNGLDVSHAMSLKQYYFDTNEAPN